MTNEKLPTKLGKEPLLDVVFELHFTSSIPGSSFIPGLLFTKLTGLGEIEALPAQQIPKQIREEMPLLKHAALMRIWKDQFAVMVGDNSMGVGCKMPYSGWAKFKAAILEILQILDGSPFISEVSRRSLKYVDLFETGADTALAYSYFNVDLRIGNHVVKTENTNIRSEIKRDGFLHAVSLVTSAEVMDATNTAAPKRRGAIIDIDTIDIENKDEITAFVAGLSAMLEKMHTANKEIFFEVLSPVGLSKLEPKYE